MRRFTKYKSYLIFISLVFLCNTSFAGKSMDDAKALVERAVEHIKRVGAAQAYREFQTAPGPWVNGDSYIFVYDFKGINLSSGINTRANGRNFWDLQSADGKYIIREMSDIAKKKGSGWIEYTWINPESHKFEEKHSFFMKVPGDDAFIGTGIYREK